MMKLWNDEINFPHKLLTNTQVSKLLKTCVNCSSANIKFSRTQLSKIVQSGGFILGKPNMISLGIPFDIITKPVEELYSFVK